jgi:hypothetical protein
VPFVHTHFGSATHLLSTFLGVLMVGTLWKLAAMHGVRSRRAWVAGLSRAALFQFN